MNQSDIRSTETDQEQGPGTDALIPLYERLLAEKDSRISGLETALSHERGKQRNGLWPDLRAGFIGYMLGVPLGLVKSLAAQAFITHTASTMVFSFLAIYFSSVVAFAFFMGRRVYRNRKAALQVGPVASHAVQLFYSVVLSFAVTISILTGPHSSSRDLEGATCLLLASLGTAGYNYWQMRADTKRVGKPLPSLLQIGAWLNLTT